MTFYKKVLHWGLCKPVHDKVVVDDPGFTRNPNFGRCMLNVAIGIVMQTSLIALPIFFVIKSFYTAALTAVFAFGAVLNCGKLGYTKLADWPHEEILQEQAA